MEPQHPFETGVQVQNAHQDIPVTDTHTHSPGVKEPKGTKRFGLKTLRSCDGVCGYL